MSSHRLARCSTTADRAASARNSAARISDRPVAWLTPGMDLGSGNVPQIVIGLSSPSPSNGRSSPSSAASSTASCKFSISICRVSSSTCENSTEEISPCSTRLRRNSESSRLLALCLSRSSRRASSASNRMATIRTSAASLRAASCISASAAASSARETAFSARRREVSGNRWVKPTSKAPSRPATSRE